MRRTAPERVADEEFELSRLVAAERQPGQIVALQENARAAGGPAQRIAESGSLGDRRWQGGQLNPRQPVERRMWIRDHVDRLPRGCIRPRKCNPKGTKPRPASAKAAAVRRPPSPKATVVRRSFSEGGSLGEGGRRHEEDRTEATP